MGSEKLDGWGQKLGCMDQRDDFPLVQDVLNGFRSETEEPGKLAFRVPSKEAGSRKRRWGVMHRQLFSVEGAS